jgi:hypothetical protein
VSSDNLQAAELDKHLVAALGNRSVVDRDKHFVVGLDMHWVAEVGNRPFEDIVWAQLAPNFVVDQRTVAEPSKDIFVDQGVHTSRYIGSLLRPWPHKVEYLGSCVLAWHYE